MALLECHLQGYRDSSVEQRWTIGTRKVVMLILLSDDYGMLSPFVVMAVASRTKGVNRLEGEQFLEEGFKAIHPRTSIH